MALLDLMINELTKLDSSPDPVRSEGDIQSRLRVVIPDGSKLEEMEKAEFYAFSFLENNEYGRENWNTYFGPPLVRLIDGSTRTAFKIEDITPEMIEYWRNRSSECSNPVLIARYSGLVYTFQKKVTNIKPDREVAKNYICNLIKSIVTGRIQYSTVCYTKLLRALELSSSLRLEELFNRTVLAVREYEKKNLDITRPGTWSKSYDLLIDKKYKIPENLTQLIIDEIRSRFDNIVSSKNEAKFDMASFEVAFSKLAEYYKRHNEDQKTR